MQATCGQQRLLTLCNGMMLVLPQAREGNTRMKTGKGGLAQREALLDSHKHRKQSRKRVHTPMTAQAHASAVAECCCCYVSCC